MTRKLQKKHCIVVGGGTAGWLSACYIKSILREEINVSIVDPDNKGTIGVGESTLPTIHRTLEALNIPFQTFIRETNGTIKQGITFKNWLKNNETFYHPYDLPKSTQLNSSFDSWRSTGFADSFANFASTQPHAIINNKSPFRLKQDGSLHQEFLYSLHIDSSEVTRFLKDQSKKIRVKQIKSKVKKVIRRKEIVNSILLEDGSSLFADLYIDCSGFKRILNDETNHYEEFSFLPCDMAIATSASHAKPSISPTTTAIAHSAGWLWDIPLFTRRGVGCVFSQAHMSLDKAHSTMMQYFGVNLNEDNFKLIPFKAGNLAQPWHGNVVNIGLSSGFIEPLESTGIYFIEEALALLTSIFPRSGDAWARKKFNKEMRDRYQECADFVYLHYLLSDRSDSKFWSEFKNPSNIPQHIKDLLEFWDGTPPSGSHFTNGRQIFGLPAHEYILYGMNFTPNTYTKSKQASQIPLPDDTLTKSSNHKLGKIKSLLDHNDFLDVAFGKKQPQQILHKYF